MACGTCRVSGKKTIGACNPLAYCHRPIFVRDDKTRLGEVLRELKVRPEHAQDDVIDHDIILVWNGERRVITGADILGRLLRGIVGKEAPGERTEGVAKR